MKGVTFSHLGMCHGWASFHDVINHTAWLGESMAAVFVSLDLSVLGAQF